MGTEMGFLQMGLLPASALARALMLMQPLRSPIHLMHHPNGRTLHQTPEHRQPEAQAGIGAWLLAEAPPLQDDPRSRASSKHGRSAASPSSKLTPEMQNRD